ncbi:BON domain-containing protein [Pseudolysobacter antarcticus]|nr:BON domain-containing protein [Pseudolysobacter antarcticus]
MPANASSRWHAAFFVGLIFLAITLSACSIYKKCGLNGCAGDAGITAAVQKEFDERSELKPPNRISIQTLDHVVYLSGLVDTEFERNIAESVAHDVPGVVRVVNSIAVLGTVY